MLMCALLFTHAYSFIVHYRLSTGGKTFAWVRKTKHMKSFPGIWLFVLALAVTLSSCEVVGGIFKAGFYTAIFLIVLVVVIILWLVRRGRR